MRGPSAVGTLNALREAKEEQARRAEYKRQKRLHNSKRQAKRNAQKKKGDAFVPEDEFVKHADRMSAVQVKKAIHYLDDALKLNVPPEFHLDRLEMDEPEIHEYITSGNPLTITKDMDAKLVGAIWFNKLDKKHTFDTLDKVAAANYALTVMAISQREEDNLPEFQPTLLVPFAIACTEDRFFKDRFVDRKHFLELWMNSPDDINMYSNSQTRRITMAAHDMKRALAQVEGTETFTDMTSALSEVLANDVGEKDLNQEGEDLFRSMTHDDINMEYGTSNVVFYNGENSIEKNLSSKPDDYRKKVFSQWVERILDRMFEQLEAMENQQDADQGMITQFMEKMRRLTRYQHLRLLAHELGFEGYEDAMEFV